MIEAARGRLAHQGYENASLWVLSGNRRAERFYMIDGWEPDGTRRQDQIGGLTVTENRCRSLS